jgi:branched-chain amino acid aminotransferase
MDIKQESTSKTYFDGQWLDGNVKIAGPATHAMWMASVVFDGARYIEGGAPDLDRHCARVVRSAELLGLAPTLSGPEIHALAVEGIRLFAADSELYIKPIFYAEEGFLIADAESTRFTMVITETPLPKPTGFSACLSSFRRPAKDMAITEAKTSSLYPNVARTLKEALEKGFDTAVVLDPASNVAEFAAANLFMVKDGGVHTPAPNGTFLNGLTRQRVISLLGDDGTRVVERAMSFAELADADELFSSANASKVMPCIRLEDRDLQPGPVFRRARELYMDFARASKI